MAAWYQGINVMVGDLVRRQLWKSESKGEARERGQPEIHQGSLSPIKFHLPAAHSQLSDSTHEYTNEYSDPPLSKHFGVP